MTGDVRVGCSGWNYAHWRELFFNNDWRGYAVANALALKAILAGDASDAARDAR